MTRGRFVPALLGLLALAGSQAAYAEERTLPRTHTQGRHSQAVRIEHMRSTHLLSRKTVDPSLKPPDTVDITGVLFHLKQGDPVAAEAELARLQDEHPDWRPPSDLLDHVALARLRQALAEGDGPTARRLSATKFDHCKEPDLAWALAESGLDGGSHSLLTMAARCTDPTVAVDSMNRYLRGVTGSEQTPDLASLMHRPWSPAVRHVLEEFDLDRRVSALKDASVPAERVTVIEQEATVLRNAAAADALGWHRLKIGDDAAARRWFLQALAWSHDTVGREGLARSLIALNDPDGAIAVAQGTPSLPSLPDVLGDAHLSRALSLAKQGARVEAIADDMAAVAALGHGEAWEQLGWVYLDEKRPTDALRAFTASTPGEGALFGRVMAQRAAGHTEEATDLACGQDSRSSRLRQACVDGLADQQLRAYRREDFQAVLRLGSRLSQLAPDRRGGQSLEAWASLRLGQAGRAAALFGSLYDASPDRDLAEGLVQSLTALGDDAAIERRLAAGDPVLADLVERRQSALAYDSKQFDLAETGVGANPALAGRDGWIVGSGVETRSVNGDSGLGRVDMIASRLYAEGMVDQVRVDLSLVGGPMRVGTPTPTADLGSLSAQRPAVSAPWTGGDLWQPALTLGWQTPGWTVAAHLSSTPLDAPMAAVPTASVAVTRLGDPLAITVRMFDEDVPATMLSWGGLRDPASGRNWGRVLQRGGALQAVYLPADQVSLSLSGSGSALSGRDVEDNAHLSLRGDAAYDLRLQSLDHLRVGPFLSIDHYDTNLSHYSFGQGGYYSPDVDGRAGVLVDGLTREGETWQAEVKTSLSYGYAYQASSPRFDIGLEPVGRYDPTTTLGLNRDLSLRGSLLLSDHLILSGFARGAMAPNYTDYTIGAFLSLALSPRRGVFSADLATGLFQPFR